MIVTTTGTAGTVVITSGGESITLTHPETYDFFGPTSEWDEDDVRNAAASINAELAAGTIELHTAEGTPVTGLSSTPPMVFSPVVFYNHGSGLINDTTTLALHSSVTTPVIPAGTYRVTWQYSWSCSFSAQTDFIAELRLNGAVIHEHRQEPKDTAGTGITLPLVGGGSGDTGTNQRYPTTCFEILDLPNAAHTAEIWFAPQSISDGNVATIYGSLIVIERIA